MSNPSISDNVDSPRAVLVLDIDGAINPYFAKHTLETSPERLPGFEGFRIESEVHGIASAYLQTGVLIDTFRKLQSLSVELVWGSAWNEGANLVLEMLGLSEVWPTIIFPEEMDFSMDIQTWKLSTVQEYIESHYAEDVPVLWIDDEIFSDAEQWISSRSGGGLLFRPERHQGVTESHWNQILELVTQLVDSSQRTGSSNREWLEIDRSSTHLGYSN